MRDKWEKWKVANERQLNETCKIAVIVDGPIAGWTRLVYNGELVGFFQHETSALILADAYHMGPQMLALAKAIGQGRVQIMGGQQPPEQPPGGRFSPGGN